MEMMFSSTKRFIKKNLQPFKGKSSIWPKPRYSCNISDYHFLFILTPPYSGSTALAQVLNSANNSMLLQKRGEGQWLIPGLCQKNRWDPSKKVDWESVKSTWLSRVSMVDSLVGKIDVIIEKSPPNIVRAEQLLDTFTNNKIITFNRNPYANCSSILYRHHSPADKTELERITILRELAANWIFRSTLIKKWVDNLQTVNFTYEQFCSSPELQIKRITDVLPLLAGVNAGNPIRVKDYALQGISNQNRRQINNLSKQEKIAISEELRDHESLLNFFGYTSVWNTGIEDGGASDINFT